MKVILLNNVIGLGRAGDIKSVKDGFARNYLVPQKIAEIATKSKEIHHQRLSEKLVVKAKQSLDDANTLKETIEKEVIEIKTKVGEEGKLFGSITTGDIHDIINARGYNIEKKKIIINHIKTAGEHIAKIKLDEGVTAEIKVVIIPEE